jgi:hypothetical protein
LAALSGMNNNTASGLQKLARLNPLANTLKALNTPSNTLFPESAQEILKRSLASPPPKFWEGKENKPH